MYLLGVFESGQMRYLSGISEEDAFNKITLDVYERARSISYYHIFPNAKKLLLKYIHVDCRKQGDSKIFSFIFFVHVFINKEYFDSDRLICFACGKVFVCSLTGVGNSAFGSFTRQGCGVLSPSSRLEVQGHEVTWGGENRKGILVLCVNI